MIESALTASAALTAKIKSRLEGVSEAEESPPSAEDKSAVSIGITGVTRCGKGWLAKGLLEAVQATGKSAIIVAQDDFWFQACQVNVRIPSTY